jgi:hypothetical protein
VAYFHAGACGLEQGAELLPPSHTGARASDRSDLVYFSTWPAWAQFAAIQRAVAVHATHVDLYVVKPIGALGGDCVQLRGLGTLEGISWHSPSAVVLAVVQRGIPANLEDALSTFKARIARELLRAA